MPRRLQPWSVLASCTRALAVSAVATLGSGCCTLASLWCGPDRSRWVPVSFETPEAALATFREAVRRDDAHHVWKSLSEGFKARNGLPGELEATVAWNRLRETVTGLHLLGEADVSAPERLAEDRIAFVLCVAGERLRVELVRQPFLEIVHETSLGLERPGSYVTSLAPHVRVRRSADGLTSSVVLTVEDLVLPMDTRSANVRGVRAGEDWKVDALDPLDG